MKFRKNVFFIEIIYKKIDIGSRSQIPCLVIVFHIFKKKKNDFPENVVTLFLPNLSMNNLVSFDISHLAFLKYYPDFST